MKKPKLKKFMFCYRCSGEIGHEIWHLIVKDVKDFDEAYAVYWEKLGNNCALTNIIDLTDL